ncbi:MAG TPA: glutaredoxin family protein, partial [Spirochaetota bacterium]|nr:glutaredoxin family protein [Spirochaetota bacterium]
MENINFTYEEGKSKAGDVTVYALSTCAFCKKALKFLRENSISFRYVYVDELDYESREELKARLR